MSFATDLGDWKAGFFLLFSHRNFLSQPSGQLLLQQHKLAVEHGLLSVKGEILQAAALACDGNTIVTVAQV